MDFVENLGDTNQIPSFHVGGVARGEVLDNCIVRITYFEPGPHGIVVPAVQLLWSIPAWLAARPALQQVADAIATGRREAIMGVVALPKHH